MASISSPAKIHVIFKRFRQKFRHTWEEYSFVEFYSPLLHVAIKRGAIDPLQFSPFLNRPEDKIKFGPAKSMAVLGQVVANSICNRALLEAIGAFEDLIGKIAETVYRDNPGKLISSDEHSESENFKLSKIVITSADKNEIIDRMIEERIRSIFYGNPANIFLKDSAKLEIGSVFSEKYKNLIKEYAEITARRNIIVHNSGRVDRKYLREVPGSAYVIGNKALVTDAYLRRSLAVLEGIAAIVSKSVVENIYKSSVTGKLGESLKSFHLGVGKA